MSPTGPRAAAFPFVLAAELAARMRHTLSARFPASADGALEEPESGLDTLLLVTEIPATLAEMTAPYLALFSVWEFEKRRDMCPWKASSA